MTLYFQHLYSRIHLNGIYRLQQCKYRPKKILTLRLLCDYTYLELTYSIVCLVGPLLVCKSIFMLTKKIKNG